MDSVLFQPPVASYKDGKEVIKLESEAGVWISALYLPHTKAKRTVLYSHGNAEDLGHIYAMLRQYQKQGYNVFAYDYRGYGTSHGVASEMNVYKDVEAAYDYLVDGLGQDRNDIIVHGRSLGSGPSTHLAATREVGGLILESGFTSAFRVVLNNESMASLDPFKNLEKLKSVTCPVLVIHGKLDHVIPFEHGQKLFDAAGKPKMSYWVERAGHNNLVRVAKTNYWKTLQDFSSMIDKVVLQKKDTEK